jgi:hypothetical protein
MRQDQAGIMETPFHRLGADGYQYRPAFALARILFCELFGKD